MVEPDAAGVSTARRTFAYWAAAPPPPPPSTNWLERPVRSLCVAIRLQLPRGSRTGDRRSWLPRGDEQRLHRKDKVGRMHRHWFEEQAYSYFPPQPSSSSKRRSRRRPSPLRGLPSS